MRFVRVGNVVSVTRPKDLRTTHQQIATEDGIHGFVSRFTTERPDDVDAGILRIAHYKDSGGTVFVHGFSAGYGVPVVGSGARRRTAEVLGRQSPRYEVTTDADSQVEQEVRRDRWL